jgi:hypothetical protein
LPRRGAQVACPPAAPRRVANRQLAAHGEGKAVDAQERAFVDLAPGLVGDPLGSDEHRLARRRPRRFDDGARLGGRALDAHGVTGTLVEKKERATRAVRVKDAPVGKEEVAGAQLGAAVHVAHRARDHDVGGVAVAIGSDASRVEACEQKREEKLAVRLTDECRFPLGRYLGMHPIEVLDRPVVRKHPSALFERVRVLEGDGPDRALANVSDEHLAAASGGDLVEIVVVMGAVRASLQEPPAALAVHTDAPSIAMLARQEGKASRCLFETQAEMRYFAGDCGQ